MPDTKDDAESALTQAEDNLKQAQVELLAARRGPDPAGIEQAETNVKQAEVELLAAQEKLRAAGGG
jgi:hypothetical protein